MADLYGVHVLRQERPPLDEFDLRMNALAEEHNKRADMLRRRGTLTWVAVILAGLAVSVNTTGDAGLLIGTLISTVGGWGLQPYAMGSEC